MSENKYPCTTCEHYRYDKHLFELRGVDEPMDKPIGYCAEDLSVIFDPTNRQYNHVCWKRGHPNLLALFDL